MQLGAIVAGEGERMPSLRSARTFLLLAVTLCIAVTGAEVFASEPPHDVPASVSQNGRFLVVSEHKTKPSGAGIGRTLVSTTYRIMDTERFAHKNHTLSVPTHFWSDSWQVTVPWQNDLRECWPIISDDGKTLILIAAKWPWMGQIMRIYRKTDYHPAELVRSFMITDLWTPQEVDPSGTGKYSWTDATPLWFAGGSFVFSDDSLKLTYRNQWQEEIEINLSDGAITRKH